MANLRDLEELKRLGAGRPRRRAWRRLPRGVQDVWRAGALEPDAERAADDRAGARDRREPQAGGRHEVASFGGADRGGLPCRCLKFKAKSCRFWRRTAIPESYVAGATVLNREGPRFSRDIDIFHDREESVARLPTRTRPCSPIAASTCNGCGASPGLHVAVAERGGAKHEAGMGARQRLPVLSDRQGRTLRLSAAYLRPAANKALAAAGRREPRDVLDLLYIHERHVRLGAVIWAAVAKDPGYSPESLIAEIRRNARYRGDDYADLALTERVDAGEVVRKLARHPRRGGGVRAGHARRQGRTCLSRVRRASATRP